MLEVTILSRPDCHLCDVVMKMAHRVQRDISFSLRRVDVSENRVLSARYADRVPVVLVDEIEVAWGAVKERDLRRLLRKARWRRPISRILSRLGLWPWRR